MRCPTCGQEVADASANVCPECGAQLPLAGAEPASDVTPAPPVVVGPPPPAFALPAAPLKPSSPTPPDPGQRRRIVLVITTIALAAIALYAGGLGLLALIVHQANAPRPETVIYQNSLQGFPGGWDNGDFCTYGSDGYHVGYGHLCYDDAVDPQGDVAVTVTVEQTQGLENGAYGIILRATKGADEHDYQFLIASNGEWALAACGATNCRFVVPYRTSDAIHTGLNENNTIKVRAQGARFAFFINQTQVGTATDYSYTFGQVGLAVGKYISCVFTNIVVARVG